MGVVDAFSESLDSQSHHTGIEMRKTYRLIQILNTLNRTILELKYVYAKSYIQVQNPLNRTILELKYYILESIGFHLETLNRTILELKSTKWN